MKRYFLLLLSLFGNAEFSAAQDTIINLGNDSIANSSCLIGAMGKLKAARTNADSSFVVVHFGDSHIQGDFMTGVIRKDLQEVFGSGGDGVLFPYSAVKSFGPKDLATTVTGTWTSADLTKNPENYPIGITGHTMVTKDKSSTMDFVYTPVDEIPSGNGKIIEKVIIWHSAENFKLKLMNKQGADSLWEDPTDFANGLRRAIVYDYKIGTHLQLGFDSTSKTSGFNFHGISFQSSKLHGLQYHRCGTVGATFLQLIAQEEFTLSQLHQVHPDLLILSFGSNESYDAGFSIDDYRKKVTTYIERIKREFPGVNIIFTDTPDTRSHNRYPVNTIPINKTLNEIASSECCGFWDLNKVMGGDGSMLFWFNNGLSAKDKLHFSRTGYALQARLFTLAFLQIYSENGDSTANIFCDTLRSEINSKLETLVGNSVMKNDPDSNTVATKDVIHVVKSGETLSIIARANNVTVKQLCGWNNISSTSVLHIGQKIIIKKSGS